MDRFTGKAATSGLDSCVLDPAVRSCGPAVVTVMVTEASGFGTTASASWSAGPENLWKSESVNLRFLGNIPANQVWSRIPAKRLDMRTDVVVTHFTNGDNIFTLLL